VVTWFVSGVSFPPDPRGDRSHLQGRHRVTSRMTWGEAVWS
jgi:hypothetical protein